VSDCELPQLYVCTEPKARKAHKCVECRAPIEPGEKYLRVGMKVEGEMSAYKQHLLCAQACEFYRDNIGDECLYYGELKEWWGADGWHIAKDDANGPEMRTLMARIFKRERRADRKAKEAGK